MALSPSAAAAEFAVRLVEDEGLYLSVRKQLMNNQLICGATRRVETIADYPGPVSDGMGGVIPPGKFLCGLCVVRTCSLAETKTGSVQGPR